MSGIYAHRLIVGVHMHPLTSFRRMIDNPTSDPPGGLLTRQANPYFNKAKGMHETLYMCYEGWIWGFLSVSPVIQLGHVVVRL